MNFWMRIAIIITVVILTATVYIITSTEEEITPDDVDDSYEKYLEIKYHITPQDSLIANLTETVLGVNHNGNLTDIDISILQDWVARNIFFREGSLKFPRQTIVEDFGGHLSLHLLEYSLILNEENTTDSFILLIDLMYKGDDVSREHSAILTFFGDKVFLSDVTIPIDRLNYICRLTEPIEIIQDIIQHTYVIQYDVKYALSINEQEQFSSNEDFIVWMRER